MLFWLAYCVTILGAYTLEDKANHPNRKRGKWTVSVNINSDPKPTTV